MSIPFRPYDSYGETRIYHTDMPHWRQAGCTYFVTYRLVDSIPKFVIENWNHEKADWLRRKGQTVSAPENWSDAYEKLLAVDKHRFLKHFNRQLNAFLDEGRGACTLRNKECAEIVSDGWKFFDGEKYELADLIVMPNHVHLLITPHSGVELEEILQSRKRQSAREINQLSQRTGALWQKHSYDHLVRNDREIFAFQRYIEKNPIKANLSDGAFLHRSFDWQSKLAKQFGCTVLKDEAQRKISKVEK